MRIYSAHTGKMARPVPIWNSLRPSCTIGSSCYRYIALLPKSFGVKTASLLTCDPGFQHEFPRPRPTFSQMHCNAPFRANGIPFSVAASRAQLRASGLSSLCSFTSGSAPETAAAAGDYTSSDAYELVFPAKSIARKSRLFFSPENRQVSGKKAPVPTPPSLYLRRKEKSTSVYSFSVLFYRLFHNIWVLFHSFVPTACAI